MALNTWNILTCGNCRKLVKLPKDIGNARALCPTCKHPLTVPDSIEAPPSEIPEAIAAAPTPEVQAQSPLPAFRSFNPDAPKIRTGRESWEPKSPEPRDIDFKDRLSRTTDPAMVQGPDDPPPLKRKRISRHELQQRNMEWDQGGERTKNTSTWRAWKRALERLPWGLILTVVLLLSLLVWKIWQIRKKQTIKYNTETSVTTPPPVPEKTKPSELELRPKTALLADILPTLKGFLGAKTSTEMKAWVREPERVHDLMDTYYQEQTPFQPVDYNALPRFDSLFAHKNFVVASMETKQFLPFTISLEKTAEGYRVDWESFEAYGEMPLKQFQSGKITKPTLFRFTIEPTSYPNLDFPSSETHQAYKLYTRNKAEMLYGYVERLSPAHEKLMSALLAKQSIFCVLRIKYPEHSTNEKQVEITHYLQTGWVLRGEDFVMPEEKSAKGVLGD
jgi:hypothetical protein